MAIVSDRNGIFRLLGTYNGLSAEVTKVTGGGMEDFNGYKVTMEGKESLSSLFVSNLEDAGFVEDGFLLLENGEFILTESNEKIILE